MEMVVDLGFDRDKSRYIRTYRDPRVYKSS